MPSRYSLDRRARDIDVAHTSRFSPWRYAMIWTFSRVMRPSRIIPVQGGQDPLDAVGLVHDLDDDRKVLG